MSVLFFGLFILFVFGKLTALTHPVFLFFGAVSYPLYLLHQNIGYILLRSMDPWLHPFVSIPVAIACVVGIAWLVHAAIEMPGMAAIRRWYRVRKGVAPLA
jgi:peptidoglycan/LPS O-acetylase OafA/YrhL